MRFAGMVAVGIFTDPALAAEVFGVDPDARSLCTGAIYVR
jgi:hypothetical protein